MIIASYWLVRGVLLITVWQMLLVFIMVVALYGALLRQRRFGNTAVTSLNCLLLTL